MEGSVGFTMVEFPNTVTIGFVEVFPPDQAMVRSALGTVEKFPALVQLKLSGSVMVALNAPTSTPPFPEIVHEPGPRIGGMNALTYPPVVWRRMLALALLGPLMNSVTASATSSVPPIRLKGGRLNPPEVFT